MLREKFYPLRTIYFYVTSGCNLNCIHCWISANREKDNPLFLDFELFKSIIEQAIPLGLSSVKLTGGEPLLHPSIEDMIVFIKNRNLSLFLETNGTLISSEIVELLADFPGVRVSVSLDSATSEVHENIRGKKEIFQTIVENITKLTEAGVKVQIIMTVMKKNRDQIEPLINLSETLGVATLKFNILQPVGSASDSSQSLSIEELISIGRWIENELSHSVKKVKLYYDYPLAFKPLSSIFKRKNIGVCKIKNIIGVLADGSYSICGIGKILPELNFGHASKDRLKDIWSNSEFLNQIRTGLPSQLKGVCSSCIMKSICLGTCIAANYHHGKDIFSPFWFCEEAYKKGLFPETRLIY